MKHVKVLAKVICDNTGISHELPIILIEQNNEIILLKPLYEYMLEKQEKSHSWRDKLINVVGLLLDYMDANYNCFQNPKDFFESFTKAIYSGTISEEGYDPSGLYWLPKRAKTANQLLYSLSEFSDWMHKEYGTLPLNPWKEANKYEERLKWMALTNKSHNSFLGHLDDVVKMSETAKKARSAMQRQVPSGDNGEVKAFPEDKIHDLLWEGYKISRKKGTVSNLLSHNWRDIAITILMHGGGLRECEPFHIWVGDVMPDPFDPQLALVRVYHPVEGIAPKDIKIPSTGKSLANREAYLRIKYGLLPRNKDTGIRHAGWKNPKMSVKQQNYMQIHWFPRQWGYLFMQVVKQQINSLS